MIASCAAGATPTQNRHSSAPRRPRGKEGRKQRRGRAHGGQGKAACSSRPASKNDRREFSAGMVNKFSTGRPVAARRKNCGNGAKITGYTRNAQLDPCVLASRRRAEAFAFRGGFVVLEIMCLLSRAIDFRRWNGIARARRGPQSSPADFEPEVECTCVSSTECRPRLRLPRNRSGLVSRLPCRRPEHGARKAGGGPGADAPRRTAG